MGPSETVNELPRDLESIVLASEAEKQKQKQAKLVQQQQLDEAEAKIREDEKKKASSGAEKSGTRSFVMECRTSAEFHIVRRACSSTSEQIARLERGRRYNILRMHGRWAKLCPSEYQQLKQTGGFTAHNPAEVGWSLIHDESGAETYLSYVNTYGMKFIHAAVVLRVRKSPSMESEVVGLLGDKSRMYKFVCNQGNFAKLSPIEYASLQTSTEFKPHIAATEGWCLMKSNNGEIILM